MSCLKISYIADPGDLCAAAVCNYWETLLETSQKFHLLPTKLIHANRVSVFLTNTLETVIAYTRAHAASILNVSCIRK